MEVSVENYTSEISSTHGGDEFTICTIHFKVLASNAMRSVYAALEGQGLF